MQVNTYTIARLERIAVAKQHNRKREESEKVWHRIEQLQKDCVIKLLEEIQQCDDEVMWTLQHPDMDRVTDAQRIERVLKSRQHSVAELTKMVEWLGQCAAKSWLNSEKVVEAALNNAEVRA